MSGVGRLAGPVLLLVLTSTAFSGCFGGHPSEWAYTITGLRTVQKHYDGTGIIVAIVDTGIDPKHSGLDHIKVIWKDEVNKRETPYDDYGHGSHVAGIIAGKGANFGGQMQGYDLKGAITAKTPTMIVVKAIRSDQTGDSAAVADGISFSIANQADVICLSLGSNPSAVGRILPDNIKTAIGNALAQGILVVASAGNSGTEPGDVATPADIDGVIAVGAVDESKHVAEFSQRGSADKNDGTGPLGLGARPDPNKKPELVAPGVKIKSAWKGGDYAEASGTSQAAPFVCGALALLLQKCPQLRAANNQDMVTRVKTALKDTAEPIAGQKIPHDNAAGYGLLRADKLLDKFGDSC